MNQTIICNDTTTSSFSNISCAVQLSAQPNPFAQFFEVAFGSSIYMIVDAFITVVANSLLLLVFYVDPFKRFRNPASYFLVGLTVVDLITGLVQEPIFASCFILGYLGHPAAKQHCPTLLRFAQILSAMTMNASFIIVLAFTATQLIVIASPLSFVTNRIVVITLLTIYAYSITFGLLNLVKLRDPNIFQQVDLFLHSFFVVYLSIACYILLCRAFRRSMMYCIPLRSENVFQGNEGRQSSNRVERKFVAVNLLLISLMFFCTQLSAILGVLVLYWLGIGNLNIMIPSLMVTNILYLKFMLDHFVYAYSYVSWIKETRI